MSRRWAYLLGHPLAHTLSPALHNAAFAALGIDAEYVARDVPPDDLPSAVESFRAADCLGGNVTAPHKRTVMDHLDVISPETVALGAVNTVVNQHGRLIGSNTDAAGLGRWMRLADVDPAGHGCRVGAARPPPPAAVWALADLGASTIVVLNRTVERAEELVTSLRQRFPRVYLLWGSLDEAAEPARAPWRVVVNATSLGHEGSAPVVHAGCYSRDSVAIELAYNPPLTPFMVTARDAGARAENGLGMLLHQAALAFERWTGQVPSMAVYEAVLKQRMAP